jgi:hypothetical protein
VYIADAARLLNCRSRTKPELDSELEALAAEDDPTRDDGLIRVLHARAMRELLWLEPVLSTGSIQRLERLDETIDS